MEESTSVHSRPLWVYVKCFFVQKRVSRKDTLPRMKLVNRDESPSRPRLLGRGCGRTDNATQTELGVTR